MYFCYDPEDSGMTFFDTAEEAQAAAQKAFAEEEDIAADEMWSESITDICWGKVAERVVQTKCEPAPEDSPFDEILDFELQKTTQPNSADSKQRGNHWLCLKCHTQHKNRMLAAMCCR